MMSDNMEREESSYFKVLSRRNEDWWKRETEALLNCRCVITNRKTTAYGKPALMIVFVLK
jgi:hypothetical protein